MKFLDGLFSDKHEKELQELRRQAEKYPQNTHLLVRIGDLLERCGKRNEALEAYQKASEQYAQGGLFIQAVAVNKIILRLDPSRMQIHSQLAELYAKRGLEVEESRERRVIGEKKADSISPVFPAIPLFADLKKEELARVLEGIVAKRFPKGAAICREGDPGDSLYIISTGRVVIYRGKAEGEKTLVNELNPGDFFGEFGFFADSTRQATVEAAEETDLLEISKKEMFEIVRQFPGVMGVLWDFYKERVLDTLLATSSIFQPLSRAERKQLLNKFTLEKFPAGATVIREGDPGDSLYIIKKGEVEVFTSSQPGEAITLARLQAGDFFGEIALLTGRPRTASVRVLQDAEIARLAKKDFNEIAADHPEITAGLEPVSQLRLENKLKALGVLQYNPVKEGMV